MITPLKEKRLKAEISSLLSLEPLFPALIIADFLAPFFIWPHWTGRFYSGWPEFFGSGLFHWLQAAALLLAWLVLRNKWWGRLWLGLAVGIHMFLPPLSLTDQLLSSLIAIMGWWLSALPALLAAGREPAGEPRAPGRSWPDKGSKRFQAIVWLVLAANLALILVLLGPVLPLALEDSGGSFRTTVGAGLLEITVFLAFLSLIFLPGRRRRLFSVPVYLAALISLGGILWLWPEPGLTESALADSQTGLLAIHITLLPLLGGLLLICALIMLILRRRPEGFRALPTLIRPGWLLALALMPLAGLGLAALPLWAGHLSRSYLSPRPPSKPSPLIGAGPLALPLPASLRLTNWATVITWPAREKDGAAPGRPEAVWPPPEQERRPGRPRWDDHGLILIETEYANTSLAEQEFEGAWRRRLDRARDWEGHPRTIEDLSDQFGRPSRLLIHYHPPRRAETKGSMVMRMALFQQRPGGYLGLMAAVPFDAETLDSDGIDRLKAARKADFIKQAEKTAAAYRWGRREPSAVDEAIFVTRFGWLDRHQLQADLEVKLQLSKTDDLSPPDRPGEGGADIWIKSFSRPAGGHGATASDDGSRQDRLTGGASSERSPGGIAERLAPLLGVINRDRPWSLLSRRGLERIRITAGGRPNSPAAIRAIWVSADGDLEVEMWSGRRLVQADLPALARLWAAILAGPDQDGGGH